jgi:class 3 adenylate cyclase
MVALTALAEVALARGDTAAGLAHASANWALAERNGEGQRVDPARSHLVRARIAAEGPAAAGETVAMLLERRWLTDHQTGCHAFISPDLAAALRLQGETRRLTELVAVLTELTEHDPNRHNRAAMAAADAELALARGQAAAAAQRFAEAAAAYALLPCPYRQARALLGAAEAALASGDAASATESAQGALVVAEALDSPSLRAEGAALIAQAEVDVVLATVLLTDIVDSTSRAASAGDRAWRGVLERHHGIVRRELQRHRGREVDTAGDGFLAAFDSPARAIRCALAVVEALEAAGIPIRAGLHTGECEVLGDKLAGIAVHTAARVAGLASAGEVMVSGTVRDLVAGAGFGFESRGIHALKGVPGEWPLYTVRRLPTAPAGTGEQAATV